MLCAILDSKKVVCFWRVFLHFDVALHKHGSKKCGFVWGLSLFCFHPLYHNITFKYRINLKSIILYVAYETSALFKQQW